MAAERGDVDFARSDSSRLAPAAAPRQGFRWGRGVAPEDRDETVRQLGKGKIATEGMALSKLAQPAFEDVMRGELSPARGAVIGAGIANPAGRARGGLSDTEDMARSPLPGKA